MLKRQHPPEMAETGLFAPALGLAPAPFLRVDDSVHSSKAEDHASKHQQLFYVVSFVPMSRS